MDEKMFHELLNHVNDDDKGLPLFARAVSQNAHVENFIVATDQIEAAAQDEGMTPYQMAMIRVIMAKAILSVVMVKQLNKIAAGRNDTQDVFCGIAANADMAELLKSVAAAIPILVME